VQIAPILLRSALDMAHRDAKNSMVCMMYPVKPCICCIAELRPWTLCTRSMTLSLDEPSTMDIDGEQVLMALTDGLSGFEDALILSMHAQLAADRAAARRSSLKRHE